MEEQRNGEQLRGNTNSPAAGCASIGTGIPEGAFRTRQLLSLCSLAPPAQFPLRIGYDTARESREERDRYSPEAKVGTKFNADASKCRNTIFIRSIFHFSNTITEYHNAGYKHNMV